MGKGRFGRGRVRAPGRPAGRAPRFPIYGLHALSLGRRRTSHVPVGGSIVLFT